MNNRHTPKLNFDDKLVQILYILVYFSQRLFETLYIAQVYGRHIAAAFSKHFGLNF